MNWVAWVPQPAEPSPRDLGFLRTQRGGCSQVSHALSPGRTTLGDDGRQKKRARESTEQGKVWVRLSVSPSLLQTRPGTGENPQADLLALSIPSPPQPLLPSRPGFQDAPCSCSPQGRVNRKLLVPCSHRSPLLSSLSPPPCPGRPSREPLQKGPAVGSRLQASPVGRACTGRGSPPGVDWSTAVTTPPGVSKERGTQPYQALNVGRGGGGTASLHSPLWKPGGFDLNPLGTT